MTSLPTPEDIAAARALLDGVAVLTRRRGVVWWRGRRQVSLWRPCAIDRTGVRLSRWPMPSVFVPMQHVDRFDVVRMQGESDPAGSSECLVLLTRDRKTITVRAPAVEWRIWQGGLPPQTLAQQLNNVLPTWRRAAGGEHPR